MIEYKQIMKKISLETRSNVSYVLFISLMTFRAFTYWIDVAAPLPKVLLWSYAALVFYILNRMRSASNAGKIQTKGAYLYFAHPAYILYACTDLVILPFTEWTPTNLATFLGFGLFIILTSHYEEQELIAHHGKPAKDYLGKVLSVYRIRTRLTKSRK